jgi:hypothetical protein
MNSRAAPDLFGRDAFGLPALGGPLPDEVLAGLGELAGGSPLWGRETEWLELVDSIRAWTCRWHGPATAAGWDVVALYGVCLDAPAVRRDMLGGAFLACHPGYQTIAIDPVAIRVVVRTSSRLSVYKPAAGGVLAWELVSTADPSRRCARG